MQMVMFMKVNGSMIRHMVKENTRIQMVLTILVSGVMTSSVGKAWKVGLMELNIQAITETA